MNGQTTLYAIAELIEDRLSPGENDEPYVPFEDILEEVRNCYSQIVWQLYMNSRKEERSAFESLLRRKRYPVAAPAAEQWKISVADLSIVGFQRDEGLVQIFQLDKDRMIINQLTKSNSALSYMSCRIDTGPSYYRIEDEIFFPEGLDAQTRELEILYMGIPDDEQLKVSREIADLVRDKVWSRVFAGREIPADVTNNSNPNL